MSATTTPIPPGRFAAALPDLPLSSLFGKAAELRNSIAHLLDSNRQLQEFADEGDRDCIEAIRENEEVIARHEERIELLRREVEERGVSWDNFEAVKNGEGPVNNGGEGAINGGERNGDRDIETGEGGEEDGGQQHGRVIVGGVEGAVNARVGGRLGDEELARRLRERMDADEENDGVHL